MKIIDLSTPFDFDYSVPQPPFTEPYTELKTINTRVRNAFYETKFTITSHNGTHMDVPSHWFSREEKEGVYSLEDIPLDWLYGETVVLDIPKGAKEPIGAKDFEKAALEIKEGDIVLVHTGWGRYFEEEPRNSRYLYYNQPGLELDGAEWLVERKIRAYGQDTMETQHPSHPFFPDEKARSEGARYVLEPVHRLMLGNDIILFEHLTNLDKVADQRIVAGFFPVLPIRGADGASIRAVAFVEN